MANTTATAVFLVTIGTLMVLNVTANETDAMFTGKRSLCSLASAKRMLKGLGISDDVSNCLLQNKRDIANLVGSYMEAELDNVEDKRDILTELEDMLTVEKRGRYCCSPQCDRFMARMGHPKPGTVNCNGK